MVLRVGFEPTVSRSSPVLQTGVPPLEHPQRWRGSKESNLVRTVLETAMQPVHLSPRNLRNCSRADLGLAPTLTCWIPSPLIGSLVGRCVLSAARFTHNASLWWNGHDHPGGHDVQSCSPAIAADCAHSVTPCFRMGLTWTVSRRRRSGQADVAFPCSFHQQTAAAVE